MCEERSMLLKPVKSDDGVLRIKRVDKSFDISI